MHHNQVRAREPLREVRVAVGRLGTWDHAISAKFKLQLTMIIIRIINGASVPTPPPTTCWAPPPTTCWAPAQCQTAASHGHDVNLKWYYQVLSTGTSINWYHCKLAVASQVTKVSVKKNGFLLSLPVAQIEDQSLQQALKGRLALGPVLALLSSANRPWRKPCETCETKNLFANFCETENCQCKTLQNS